jgi:hypothetical protein
MVTRPDLLTGPLVDTIVLMLETPGPRAASDTDVYHWHPVRERIQPILLQAILMGLNPLEVYEAAVKKFGKGAPTIQLIFGRTILDGRQALAELYWARKGLLDSLWWRAIREPPDWEVFRGVLAGAQAWGAWPEDVYQVALEHYPLNAVVPLPIWSDFREYCYPGLEAARRASTTEDTP